MWKLYIILLNTSHFAYGIDPGPDFQATKGEVWPKPLKQEKSNNYYIIKPQEFNFELLKEIGCPGFISEVFTRYQFIINSTISLNRKRGVWEKVVLKKNNDDNKNNDELFLGNLENIVIEVENECPGDDVVPTLRDYEDYSLSIDEDGAYLYSLSIWGVLRGLETFSQLIYLQDDALVIHANFIEDYPSFPHRGILIDTSRHFQPVSIILQMLDAMTYNKFNVLHWHMTDDHSFPYQSSIFPELSEQGAYHPELIYDQNDVRRVIEYARLRGIRVIPEFDTPGHTRSWGVSHPELLTTCYNGDEPSGELGPMDPTKEGTYDFISELFKEVLDIFLDSYFHIGGDEVDSGCWESNPDISDFMDQHQISTYVDLETYFIQKVIDILADSNYLVWEEVFVSGVNLPNSSVVQVWREDGLSTIKDVVEAGKYAVYSSCWYFASLQFGADWTSFYECDPLALIQNQNQRDLVLGGEACMWGEYVNEYNIIPEVWPAASAVAERLWSAADVTDVEEAQRRLEEHACRMNKRGIDAQPPNGPGFCV